jgi:hypothetical protein
MSESAGGFYKKRSGSKTVHPGGRVGLTASAEFRDPLLQRKSESLPRRFACQREALGGLNGVNGVTVEKLDRA